MHILFITSRRVGDAVLSTGLLHTLIDTHPGACVTVACGAAAAPLFEAVPNLERVIVLDKMLFSFHWLRLWALSVGRIWDVLVDVRNAPVTYLLAARQSYRIGRSREAMHRVQWLGDVLGMRANPPAPHIWTLESHRETARRLIPEGAPVLAVGPTANWAAKTWRAERFVTLIERLAAPTGILP